MVKKCNLGWIPIEPEWNSENKRYFKSKPACKARIRTNSACSSVILQKNEHSNPQDEQETERHNIRSDLR